jgi:hypothetical protein
MPARAIDTYSFFLTQQTLSSMENNSKAIWGFVAGFFAGITVGILVTSDERKEKVRKQVEDLTKNLKQELSSNLEKGIDKLNDFAKSTFENIGEYADKVLKKDNNGSSASK